jgi:hypothetical protein
LDSILQSRGLDNVGMTHKHVFNEILEVIIFVRGGYRFGRWLSRLIYRLHSDKLYFQKYQLSNLVNIRLTWVMKRHRFDFF